MRFSSYKKILVTSPGDIVGKWTVLKQDTERKPGQGKYWICRCVCGTIKSVRQGQLHASLRNHITTCGCGGKGCHSNITHGLTRHDGYRAWVAMHQRCENEKVEMYKYYGGRGIKVCKEWSVLEQFILDMGPRPSAGHSIDRIDPNGDYSPENCRWATRDEQSNNKRNTIFLTHEGLKKSLKDWSRETGVAYTTLKSRWLQKASSWEILHNGRWGKRNRIRPSNQQGRATL